MPFRLQRGRGGKRLCPARRRKSGAARLFVSGAITRGQARFAVALLFGVNFLNYIDRSVLAAVLPLIS